MLKHEQGSVFAPVLLLTALLLLYLIAFLPNSVAYRQNIEHEWGKLQAERNAEAGVYTAINAWLQDPIYFKGEIYSLANGTATVSIQPQPRSKTVIVITAKGDYDSIYTSNITALYETEQSRWLDWMR
ncbi:hypothetical protein BEP19_00860 [Ammoniphilus oxalaticus]|uniref:Uncharacterized protein n=1 Tax=Ammoniphilus oxalaticus TaxID=66863 RepID=A0A419SMK6_9BACL|nr:hypothetical protein [Ammoniphilus oxalaticus]RKD25528.1 hypothetical protein BEP19_00860 [Ammoniphilus oxalaticus]